MFRVDVEVQSSAIDGRGVFARHLIPRDTIVWQFADGHDRRLSVAAFAALSPQVRAGLERIAYLSPATGLWVIPPPEDPACFTNHSTDANTVVRVDPWISSEPFFVARRDILAGEEITDNYLEFDRSTEPHACAWL
jgi:hypothetical protein